MWYVCVYIYACVCVYVSEKYMFALKCKQEDMYMCMYTTVKKMYINANVEYIDMYLNVIFIL